MQSRIIAILAATTLFGSCATQTTPTGGPKDETPPKLVSSNPKNGELNFDNNTVEVVFDELIKLQNPKDEIIIIPPLGKKTQFVVRKNKLLITPETAWQENTTYSISFREAVQDINEGNPVTNLKIAFSTGASIDSLKIEGNVRDALSEKIPEGITVAIFDQDTFNIFNHSPSYFTKANEEGKFSIGNLKAGTYRLYAFNDKNKNLKIDSRNEMYAFKSDSIQLKKDSKQNVLRLVTVDSRPLVLSSIRARADVNTIRFNKQVQQFKIISAHKIRALYGSDHSEITSYYPELPQDSIQVTLSASDSLNQKIDTLIYLKKTTNERIKDPSKFSFKDPILIEETGILTTQFTTNKLITTFTPDSLYLDLDSALRVYLPTEAIKYDTLEGKVHVEFKLTEKSKSKKQALRLGKGFLVSIDGDSIRRDTKNLKVIASDQTGAVLVEAKTKHPFFIIQLLRPNGEVIEERRNEQKPIFKHLSPQNIKVRLIIDRNNNGIWDTANYLSNTEAEEVYYYQTDDGKYETPIRANWELGPLVVSSE
jgi:hypothetical protein